MTNEIELVAVNVANRWALTVNGDCLYISEFFDEFGDDTLDPDEAVCGICECSDGWICVDFNQFQRVVDYH